MGQNNESWKQFKQAIIDQLKWQDVYGNIKQIRDSNNEWKVGLCPLHNDKHPSFAFNTKTLQWVCFKGCGKGSSFDYLIITEGGDFKDTLLRLGRRLGIPLPDNKPAKPPINEDIVNKYNKNLDINPDIRRYLNEKRGLSDMVIAKYQIGWDTKRQRNTIPIRDIRGNIMNIRFYNAKKDPKIMSYKVGNYGYGSPARLYGVDELVKYSGDQVIITEGEWDRLLLMQDNFMTVTGTAGCTSFRPEWTEHFKGKHVVIMYDVDIEGQKAAVGLVIKAFKSVDILSIKNVKLPLKGTKDDKDITDAIVKRGWDREQIQKLIDETPAHDYTEIKPEHEILLIDSFIEIDQKELVDKRIQVELAICGETSESFHAVEEFEVIHCDKRSKGECLDCGGPITIEPGAQEFIGSCMSTNVQIKSMLRAMCCQYGRFPTLRILKKATIKEFFCHQRVHRMIQTKKDGEDIKIIDGKKQELIEKRVYHLSSDHVNPGSYLATGWVKSHPKTQQVTFLIEELIPQEDDYQSFDLKANTGHLRAFQALNLNDILDDLTNNVTRIYYDRNDLLLAILLTYCSPLYITFNDEIIHGWLNTIVIGDSGTGKTQTFERIANYIEVGDMFSGLTGSRTGLAYALVDHKQKGWQVKIGRYPANTGKILIVDEAQYIEPYDLRTISKAMEAGFFQVDRVRSKGYKCETRLILVCNPKHDKIMNAFGRGCESLKSIFPSTIIRRVDLAVFLNSTQYGGFDEFNRHHKKQTKSVVTPDMLRAVIYWIWNLKPDQVYFESKAEQICLSKASEMSEKYGSCNDIPLVPPSDFRNIIARIATAVAGLEVSSNADYTALIVKPDHVYYATGYLDAMYSDNSCALDQYSAIKSVHDNVTDEEYEEIKDMLWNKIEKEKHIEDEDEVGFSQILKTLWELSWVIKRNDLADQAGCSSSTIGRHIAALKQYNLIESGRYGYKKTPKFNILVNRLIADVEFPKVFKGEK